MKTALTRHITLAIVILAISASGTLKAQAADFSVGAFVGPSFVNNTDSNSSATGVSAGTEVLLGVDATYKLKPFLNTGIRVGYESLGSATSGALSISASMVTVLAQANYLFTDLVGGLYAGALIGLGVGSSSETGFPSATSTTFAIGPQVGYDYVLGGDFSVGANFNYLVVAGTTGNPSINGANVLGMLKYWF